MFLMNDSLSWLNVRSKLLSFGFTDGILIDNNPVIAEIYFCFQPREAEYALDRTIKKFKDKPVKANQFLEYWRTTCFNLSGKAC